MENFNIDFAKERELVHETFDLIEMARAPIYAIMLLKAEHTMFKGSKNKSKEFAQMITKGLLEDSNILEMFLEKTLGEKNPSKHKELFENFKKSLNSSYNETRYFGNVIFDEPISIQLKSYLEDPTNPDKQEEFMLSLSEMFNASEVALKAKATKAANHLESIFQGGVT